MNTRGTDEAPKVSVIMPTFNVARYVRDAIDSVLAQRFHPYELLIADDGSTDGTADIVRDYSRRPGVRVFQNASNLGAALTRNRLLNDARGVYVTPCDADDLLLPGNLRRLSACLDAMPETGVVYADVLSVRTDEHDRLVEAPWVSGADCDKTWDLRENVVNHGGSMSRRAVLLAVGGYDAGLYSVDDWGLWLKVAERTRIRYLPGEIYYVWRRRPKALARTDELYRESVRHILAAAATRRGFATGDPSGQSPWRADPCHPL